MNFKEPEGMLARWLSVLSIYDYEVQHRKGTLHSNADGLSRMPPGKCKHKDYDECALKVSECVCVVTGSQGTRKPKGMGDLLALMSLVGIPAWQLRMGWVAP